MRTQALILSALLLAGTAAAAPDTSKWLRHQDKAAQSSAAYQWLDLILEANARSVDRVGARPTILSRDMAIEVTAMYDAWAAYDGKAVGTRLGGRLRRPAAERTEAHKATAIAYAVYRALLFNHPEDRAWLESQMQRMGHDPKNDSTDVSTPIGVGNVAAAALIEYRRHDGANQLGDEVGSLTKKPFSDYTYYAPVNPGATINNPDRWQPIPFSDGKGGFFTPGFLTPHWYRVKPFALERSDQFRPGPPPKVGDPKLDRELKQVVDFNASLTLEQKATVEFMRDGPRSTGQSGHWLRFAQDVSRRDGFGIDQDVKLFFSVANVAFDAFIACWDAKRFYDSSRPWTLVRHLYKGQKLMGWAGPGKGVKKLPAEQWHPYSPANFITPPFPGYPSGHSTVSAAAAKMLKLFTGSDRFEVVEHRRAGVLTEEGMLPEQMQSVNGKAGSKAAAEIVLLHPTFSQCAEMAGISRIMGGYHIESDNVEGLAMGRTIATYSWPKYQAWFNGTAAP